MRIVSLLMSVVALCAGLFVRNHFRNQQFERIQQQLSATTGSGKTFGPFDEALGKLGGGEVSQQQMAAMQEMLNFNANAGSCGRQTCYQAPEAKPPADVRANPFVD